MTRDELLRALRIFTYDKSWQKKHGRVPIRALERQCGVSQYALFYAARDGILSDRLMGKLAPTVEKIMAGRARFVPVGGGYKIGPATYVFQDDEADIGVVVGGERK